jgi:hypothetical protein
MKARRLRLPHLRPSRLLSIGMLGVLACTDRRQVGATSHATATVAQVSKDSLVARAPGGTEIWLTMVRADSGATGRCSARAVEIRREGRRIPVPLLYTSTLPEVLNDTTLRARLSDHCAPGDPYLVDLRTGRPVREQ